MSRPIGLDDVVALVPAAGRSTRMGRPKLLLPLGERSVLGCVLTAFRDGGATRSLVIVPPPDRDESEALTVEASAEGAEVLVLDHPTPDMRATIERGLEVLARRFPPALVLVAPADSPGITASTVSAVISSARAHPNRAVVPVHDGRRGHPLALPWALAERIPTLPAGVGLNALLQDEPPIRIEVDAPGLANDLDTPEDYQRWLTSLPGI